MFRCTAARPQGGDSLASDVLTGLLEDLAAEQASLDAVVGSIDESRWATTTPAEGWDVRDSISHLCFFDEAATTAIVDPDAFEAEKAKLVATKQEGNDPDVALGRAITAGELLERWRTSSAGYRDASRAKGDHRARIPWYGPPMSLASFTTARIMETWAHGVDIRDALGVPIEHNERLRHVCHIGAGARPFAFIVHGVEDPGDPVTVTATDTGWTWGPPDVANRIDGTALDLALVFTQRRHPKRTTVKATGPVAEQWLAIAQAFAGGPTTTSPDR